MIKGQTSGKTSTEFYSLIAFYAVGIILILGELVSKAMTSQSLGVDLQNLFYAMFGAQSFYTGARTVVKGKVVNGMNNEKKIEVELEKSIALLEKEESFLSKAESVMAPTPAPSFPTVSPITRPSEDTKVY